MANEIFIEFISSNIIAISALLLSVFSIILSVWTAYHGPQAKKAKIDIQKHNREKLCENFKRLDDQIFDYLPCGLFARSEPDSLELDYRQPNIDILKEGILFLQKDHPEFEKRLTEFQQNFEKYNTELQSLYNNLDSRIRLEFGNQFAIKEGYDYSEQDYYVIGVEPIKLVILILISRFLINTTSSDYKSIHSKCLEVINRELNRHAKIMLEGAEKFPFQILGYSITNFPCAFTDSIDEQRRIKTEKENSLKKEEIINHICSIVSDEKFFISAKEIFEKKSQLMGQGMKLSQVIKSTYDLVKKRELEKYS